MPSRIILALFVPFSKPNFFLVFGNENSALFVKCNVMEIFNVP
jgi:hypothetical protein